MSTLNISWHCHVTIHVKLCRMHSTSTREHVEGSDRKSNSNFFKQARISWLIECGSLLYKDLKDIMKAWTRCLPAQLYCWLCICLTFKQVLSSWSQEGCQQKWSGSKWGEHSFQHYQHHPRESLWLDTFGSQAYPWTNQCILRQGDLGMV